MKRYSPAFVTALLGMSAITHAYADTVTLTPEQIDRMYISEVRVAGKMLRCFQGGTEILYEVGLQDVKEDKARISAVRLDGASLDVIVSGDTTCAIVTRKPKK